MTGTERDVLSMEEQLDRLTLEFLQQVQRTRQLTKTEVAALRDWQNQRRISMTWSLQRRDAARRALDTLLRARETAYEVI